MGFNTTTTINESNDVDHQETTNRTHDDDDITPTSVETTDIATKDIPTDETANRSFGTWEENTTGTDITIYIRVGSNADGTQIRIDAHINSTQTDNLIYRHENPNADRFTKLANSFDVPDGAFYKVEGSGATDEELATWHEQT
jgi:hypothetical protein